MFMKIEQNRGTLLK